jgi:hypothetical protein
MASGFTVILTSPADATNWQLIHTARHAVTCIICNRTPWSGVLVRVNGTVADSLQADADRLHPFAVTRLTLSAGARVFARLENVNALAGQLAIWCDTGSC